MSASLKPCPFCGGEAEIYQARAEDYGYRCSATAARCKVCKASSPAFDDAGYDWDKREHTNLSEQAEQSAANWWNRRSDPSREAMREATAKSPDHEALEGVARQFIAWAARHQDGVEGCHMCGGVPHNQTCFARRFQIALELADAARAALALDGDAK